MIYVVLVIIRCWTCTFPGYIHPDEFFQGGQELFFGSGNYHYVPTYDPSTPSIRSFHNHHNNGSNDVSDDDDSLHFMEHFTLSNHQQDTENQDPKSTFSSTATTTAAATTATATATVQPPPSSQPPTIFQKFLLDTLGLQNVHMTATWEFQQRYALRSIIPPLVMTYFPLQLYRLFWKGGGARALYDRIISNQNSNLNHHIYDDTCSNIDEIIEDDTFHQNVQDNHRKTCSSTNKPNSNNHSNHNNVASLSGYEILIIPRLFMSLLSILAVDASLFYILKATTSTDDHDETILSTSSLSLPLLQMIVYASSWTTLVFLNRTFTNTMETFFLAILFALVVKAIRDVNTKFNTMNIKQYDNHHNNEKESGHTHYISSIRIGFICSLGLFTRFTFAFFAFPIVITFLHQTSKQCSLYSLSSTSSSSSSISSTSLTRKIILSKVSTIINSKMMKRYCHEFAMAGLFIFIGFAIASSLIIQLDTAFYTLQRRRSGNSCSRTSPILPLQHDDTYNIDVNHNYNDDDDNQEYHNLHLQDFVTSKSSSFVVTPWNALRYNSNTSNLSNHGIHPRITHSMVNMPLLYGPLTILCYLSFCKALLKQIKMKKKNVDNLDTAHEHECINGIVNRMCYAIIIIGLGILSCAPHQEPRFLLPLLIPVMILHATTIAWTTTIVSKSTPSSITTSTKTNKASNAKMINSKLISSWVGLNLVILIFFGTLHQGGVIPSLLHLSQMQPKPRNGSLQTNRNLVEESSDDDELKAILYYHTYMPPTFLLRHGFNEKLQSSDSFIRNMPELLDLKGNDQATLMNTITSTLNCGGGKGGKANNEYLYLVTPPVCVDFATNSEDKEENDTGVKYNSCSFSSEFVCKNLWSYHQISTEDLPSQEFSFKPFLNELRLDLFEVKCKT